MTTHVFIVNETTFPIHLQYLFAGTGAGDKEEHFGLLADIKRVRPKDKVIFYLERVGFYGVFKIADSKPIVFSDSGYLKSELDKKLIYRTLIEPDLVYPDYISEWDALDKLPLYAKDVIWSLIYRKLKGIRGCTPITPDESERLIEMIGLGNHKKPLRKLSKGECYSWDKAHKKIKIIKGNLKYIGKKRNCPDLIEEIIKRDQKNRAYEDVLEAYFTENAGSQQLKEITGSTRDIFWLGNQVYCGVGMQKIDIFTITGRRKSDREHRLIELKDDPLRPEIISYQINRYADWTRSYILGADNSNIQPIVVARKVVKRYGRDLSPTKEWTLRNQAIKEAKAFNGLKKAKKIALFEYDLRDNQIDFDELNY